MAGQSSLGATVTGRLLGKARAADRADRGDTQVHPLDDMAADGSVNVAIAVAEALFVGVVEALGGFGERGRIELTRRQVHADFPRLSEVPQVGAAADAGLARREAF